MKVGYARVEITPQESVPMAGYSNTSARMSRIVLDPLYATCIAFEAEDGKRALVYTVDMVDAGSNCTTEVRPAVSAATGIPVDFIQVSGTHTHAGPDMLNVEQPSIVRFLQYYTQQMVAAARAALADLEEAKLRLATVTTQKGLNFVRHYRLADGTYAGPNFGHPKLSPYVGYESEPDRSMQLARIARPGRPDILLCNFQVHQTDTGGVRKLALSADIAGAMRAEVEAKTGWQFAYFTGAAGNLNPVSSILEDNIIPRLDHVAHGRALAKCAIEASGYTEAQFGEIRAKHAVHEGRVDHTLDRMVPQAREIMDYYAATNDRDGATRMAREKYGFSSVYHAKAILFRAEMPETSPIPADVLSVGDLAFAVAPYEMFDTNGMEIKAASPFKMTMVLTVANMHHLDYLPTRLTFSHGSYASDTCLFEAGIGEDMTGLFIQMLQDIF